LISVPTRTTYLGRLRYSFPEEGSILNVTEGLGGRVVLPAVAVLTRNNQRELRTERLYEKTANGVASPP
jgi:hypothetical protein